MRLRRIFLTGVLVALTIGAASAQEDQSSSISPELRQALDVYLEARDGCLDFYHFGSVTIAFEETPTTVTAGDTVRITGEAINHNDYPLEGGKIIARVLREDDTVAARDWHPIIEDITLEGDYSLEAKGSASFSFAWKVPKHAPNGPYRVEFSYLTGGRYVMGGLPYLANFTTGSVRFGVVGSENPVFITFDRSSMLLNAQPLSLRAIPESSESGSTVTVDAVLGVQGAVTVPVRLRVMLFNWSDSEGAAPLLKETTDVIITPEKPLQIPIAWKNAKPGAYELVLAAVPFDLEGLPSLLKVRFPVTGDTPHIIYSGIGKIDEEKGEVTVTTCAVNGAPEGGGEGRLILSLSDGSTILAQNSDSTAGILSSVNITIPLAKISDALVVTVSARNAQGEVTDGGTQTFPKEVLHQAPKSPASSSSSEEARHPAAPDAPRAEMSVWIWLLPLVALLGTIGAITWRIRRTKAPAVVPPPAQ